MPLEKENAEREREEKVDSRASSNSEIQIKIHNTKTKNIHLTPEWLYQHNHTSLELSIKGNYGEKDFSLFILRQSLHPSIRWLGAPINSQAFRTSQSNPT